MAPSDSVEETLQACAIPIRKLLSRTLDDLEIELQRLTFGSMNIHTVDAACPCLFLSKTVSFHSVAKTVN
ncbi:hypothetical protein [Synechococcus sp. UW69]|uniref:hypothetical protein n=1 Tax=Synechococcus sp. UW69 TaxID=368493 RepID=UPI0010BDB848|nr:hypothetical protein [Synechococcus sp. UW69]